MRASASVLAAIVVLAGAGARNAWADTEDRGADYDPGKALRRSDFAAGLSFSGAYGSASGYPNEAAKIGVAQYHADTGAAGGQGLGLWLGAALRDWLVVGIDLSAITVGGSGTISMGGGLGVHLEACPAFYAGGAFRDLALVGEFGFGGRTVKYASRQVADGGAVSNFALGVLYEPIRVGRHVSGGPIVLVSHEFSETLTATFVTAGFQMSYFGGPG